MPPHLFYHVDVFASGPLTGNGLTVFLQTDSWPTQLMQKLTREMRQFESIFLAKPADNRVTARIFTVEEELPFAGHPILGAAAVLHRVYAMESPEQTWELMLKDRRISVKTSQKQDHMVAEMNQGIPEVGAALSPAALRNVLQRTSLQPADLVPQIPVCVCSTGLPYLIIPVQPEALDKAAIIADDLDKALAAIGAKFLLFLDPIGREMRTWDNKGRVEDVATGSAAGPAAALLQQINEGPKEGQQITLSQGRWAGRPSLLQVRITEKKELLVRGSVWPISRNLLEPLLLPARSA